jgi:hypothetical protein
VASLASAASVIATFLLVFCTAALGQDAHRDSTVELFYVAAADCGFCRRWEAQYLDGQRPLASLDWAHVRFTRVDIGTFRARFNADDAPAHLRPGMAKAMAAAGQTSLRGTPWFALFVDGEVRAHAFGTTAFETRIQPAMRAALRENAPAART